MFKSCLEHLQEILNMRFRFYQLYSCTNITKYMGSIIFRKIENPVKKIQSFYFDLNQKIYFIQNEGNSIAHILYESVFWFRKNSAPEFFLRRKKIPASVPKSGVLEYCLARVWLDWMMVRGQNTDFPEAKWLYDIIQQLFWSLNALGILS